MSAPLSIAELNDAFRKGLTDGTRLVTAGIAALSDLDRFLIQLRVQAFDGFTPDNDPYGEHDFGSFDHPAAGRVFWKIDYYDRPNTGHGSEDPANPDKTTRVLTIMLASEY